MKNIIFLLFLIPVGLQAQSIDQKLDRLYRSEYFKGLDLIITPEQYNPGKEAISYIEFIQDSATNFNDSGKIYASIDGSQDKSLNYVIGTIGDYQACARSVNVIIRKVYLDGTEKNDKITINFDDIPPPGVLEAEYAEYSIDVEITDGVFSWL